MHSNPELETLITEATVFSIAMAVVMLLLVFSIPLKPALQLLWSIIKLINAKLGNRGLGHCTYYQTKKMPRQQPYAEKLAACQSTYPTKSYHPVDQLDDAFNELEQKVSTGNQGESYHLSQSKEPPIMPLRWSTAHTEETTTLFLSLPVDRQHAIDMKVMQLFCNLGILGLLPSSLPGTLPALNQHQIAQFRQLVFILEATFAHIDATLLLNSNTLTGANSPVGKEGPTGRFQQHADGHWTDRHGNTVSQSIVDVIEPIDSTTNKTGTLGPPSTPTQVHCILNGRLHIVTNPITYERIADLCGMADKSPTITFRYTPNDGIRSEHMGQLMSRSSITVDSDQLYDKIGQNIIINCTCTTAGHP